MAKNRDFLDYVSLGAQLVQTAHTGALREQLSALSQLEAEKLDAVQREKALQEREDKIRDFVFNGNQLIADLQREAVRDDPCRSLVILYGIRRYVDQYRIQTTSVRAYEDKERMQSFLTALKRVIADCEGRIDQAAREKAELCVKYKSEQAELDELIEIEERHALAESQKYEMDRLRDELQRKTLEVKPIVPFGVSISLFLGGLLLAIRFAWLADDVLDVSTAAGATEGLLIIFGLILIPTGLLLMTLHRNLPPELLQLSRKIEDESRKLVQTDGGNVLASRVGILKQRFGAGNLDTYRRMAQERTAFINSVMEAAKDS